ncbi:cellulase N-terminal Ig-like domain-containing protein [Rhizobium sp. 32-5/1]|uniref:cellulase N-terminal Ig-like domain-containing protein n=1 Tax=Rhizobium sp. 32-5/1 TaxID=3019602 RepID=UPI00240D6FFD|nr:cellulase N-terminal Ig-like domain-containing protein [Rhizobium sp. 32-5/1]WEZ82887.1 cellulase N-terminal Ig-like domain-containing protein [Rhizobium sp. 32-5/1]
MMTSRKFLAALALPALFSPLASAQAAEMIADGAFDKGSDTVWASGGVNLSREDGQLCASIPAGGQAWDRLIGVNDLSFIADTPYLFSVRLESSEPRKIPVLVQRNEEPWTAQASFNVASDATLQAFSSVFRAKEGNSAQVIFQLGGAQAPWRMCLDVLSVREASAEEMAQAESKPQMLVPDDASPRVNQAGYFADGPKRATVLSEGQEPLPFQLVDAAETVVGEGMTEPMGFDATVEAGTQVADFSKFQTPGEAYKLVVGDKASQPFSIGHDIYSRLRIDALSWFYPQRSGTEIKGEIAGRPMRARPAI